MVNPITGNRKYLLIYISLWVIVMIAHFFLLYFYEPIDRAYLIIDSVIYNGLFFLLGLGIWYIVRYNDLGLKNLSNLLIGHIISGAILIGFWLWLSDITVNKFISNKDYAIISENLRIIRIILGVLYYLVLILVYYLIIYYKDWKTQIEQESKLEAKSREAELNALKAQINPHFLFNSLNSISSLVLTDPQATQEMIVKLSDFLRGSFRLSNDQFTRLEEEVKISENYISIEKVRFGDKLIFILQIDPNAGKEKVPHLILQPILENCIKHGVQESINPVEIVLAADVKDNEVIIRVSNKFEKGIQSGGSGIGLSNVRERLRLIYGNPDLLKYGKDNDIFEVIIRIPIK